MLRSHERKTEGDLTPEEIQEIQARGERLRQSSNVVFALSFLVALGVHLLVLLRGPTFEIVQFEESQGPGVTEIPLGSETIGTFVNVMFLPPEIFTESGELRTEPPGRVLDARYVDVGDVLGSPACEGRELESVVPFSGRVQVRVSGQGQVIRSELSESLGDGCRDAMISGIASSVLYRWLPNDEAPAPVDLIQAMRVLDMEAR